MSTDFPNGVASVNEYLDTRHHIKTDIQGQLGENAKVVVKSEYDYTMREIICNLLAGRGLKLPNIQVCLSVNLKAILNTEGVQQELLDALNELDEKFDEFMDHTNIEQVLGRINKALAEVTQIANMINFCATPVDPIAIPNVLEQTMDSFLGAGKSLINEIGNMVPDQIGGCLNFDGQEFNLNLFNGGLLGDLSADWLRVKTGQLTQNELNAFNARINKIKDDLSSLMDRENSVIGTENLGGSQFANDTDVAEVNPNMGVLHNASAAGIQGNTRVASLIKALYDKFAGYPVVDADGNVYNNIFELILEPGLLDLLRKDIDPSPDISNTQPVYNYCGEIVGYTTNVSQTSPSTSSGDIPVTPNSPGYNAGGFNTTSSGGGISGGTTVINNTTVTGGTIHIVGSEAAQLNLNINENDIVVRTDQDISYVKNSNNTGTMADFTQMAIPFDLFVRNLDQESGNGIVVKDGVFSKTRKIVPLNGQLSINNDNGTTGDIEIGLAENPVIPGTKAVQIPSGTTAQRPNTTPGELRYNTTVNAYEAYYGGSNAGWRTFATGSSSVNNASNIGPGTGLFVQNNNGNLEFKTLAQSGAITLTTTNDLITIGDNLSLGSVGTGESVIKQRNVNTLEFKSIKVSNNLSISTTTDEIRISGDEDIKKTSLSTVGNTLTEVLFDSARIVTPPDSSFFITVTAIGRQTNWTNLSYQNTPVMTIKKEGVVDNTNGTVTIVSNESNTVVYNNNANSNWELLLGVAPMFKIFVRGSSGADINWTVKAEMIRVS
jgi:hypothetical protein